MFLDMFSGRKKLMLRTNGLKLHHSMHITQPIESIKKVLQHVHHFDWSDTHGNSTEPNNICK